MFASLRRFGVVVALLAVAGCGRMNDGGSNQAGGTGASDALQGAWRIAGLKVSDDAVIVDPPGLYLFSANRYSITYSNAGSGRPPFAKADAPTDAEKLQAYGTIIANAGTYSLAGDTLVIRPTISKHPGFMGGGEERFTVRTAGDTLWLTSIGGAFRWANGAPSTSAGNDSFTLLRAR